MNKVSFEPVIGLEIHAQLKTKTKIFCGCSTEFSLEPNSNICPVCAGHPGVLPVLNKKAVEFAVRMGLATNSSIRSRSYFARKNYFYPDLPKGYQISQFDMPICERGELIVRLKNREPRKIRIHRIHLEEDAGKSIHDQSDATLIDVNRCGIPLLEIVSEPDISSAEEAAAYAMEMRRLVRWLGICDGNMEEGSLRCDANVSIRPVGQKELGVKTEIKNMNSFKSIERAIANEIERQTGIIEDGGTIVSETLLWNSDTNDLVSMRSKEESHDYRYFPEPDLLPLDIDSAVIEEIRRSLPELPNEKKNRFVIEYLLSDYDADVLTQERNLAEYFEQVCGISSDYKSNANWVTGELLRILNEQKINVEQLSIAPASLGELIKFISAGTISTKIAKEIFAEMLETNASAEAIIKQKGLEQISNESELEKIIDSLYLQFPNELAQLREGKEKVIGFFVGKVMKQTNGKANPQIVNQILKKQIAQ